MHSSYFLGYAGARHLFLLMIVRSSRPVAVRTFILKDCLPILICLATSCASVGRALSSNIEIKRSGVLAPGEAVVREVYWVDNARVLFIGARKGATGDLPDGRKYLKRFLMQWNTSSGELVSLAELGENASLCYSDGYVRYSFRLNGRFVVRVGQLGREVDIDTTKPAGALPRLNAFTCREYDERQLESKIGLKARPLREGDGYWAGNDTSRTETILIKPTPTGFQKLNIAVPYNPPPQWSAYANVYLFKWSDRLDGVKNPSGKLWLLRPDAEVRVINIPPGPWFGGGTGYGITKRGIFMWSHAGRNKADGGYLLEGMTPTRFIEGYISAFGISLDGCRIAISVGPFSGSDGDVEMVAADVCKNGG